MSFSLIEKNTGDIVTLRGTDDQTVDDAIAFNEATFIGDYRTMLDIALAEADARLRLLSKTGMVSTLDGEIFYPYIKLTIHPDRTGAEELEGNRCTHATIARMANRGLFLPELASLDGKRRIVIMQPGFLEDLDGKTNEHHLECRRNAAGQQPEIFNVRVDDRSHYGHAIAAHLMAAQRLVIKRFGKEGTFHPRYSPNALLNLCYNQIIKERSVAMEKLISQAQQELAYRV